MAGLKTELVQNILLVVGSIVIQWSYIERLLDILVETIHQNGGNAIQDDLPPTLDRELDYLKKALKRGLVPQHMTAETERLQAELHNLKDFRHNLVHGIVKLNDPKVMMADNLRVRGRPASKSKRPTLHNKSQNTWRERSSYGSTWKRWFAPLKRSKRTRASSR